MKLRIKGNSIRLRLLKSEVERFAGEGRIGDETGFGANTLRYSLVMSADAASIRGEFENGEIRVIVPQQTAREWATSNEVGFEAEQTVGSDGRLTILVEKDFACLDRPDDPDRGDAFPNPNAACAPSE